MRTFRLATLVALTAVAVVGCKQEDHDATRPSRLTLLFTTDEHSHLFAFGNEGDDWPLPTTAGDGSLVGGVARRATIIGAQRTAATQRGGDSLVVSSGDFSQGTLAAVAFTTSNPDLGLMRALGYDVVALGNHEFELGPAALAAAVGGAVSRGQAVPLVLTNVAFDDTSAADDTLAALYGERGSGKAITRSRVVETVRGLRVGFVSSMGFDAARGAAAAAPVSFGHAITQATTADGVPRVRRGDHPGGGGLAAGRGRRRGRAARPRRRQREPRRPRRRRAARRRCSRAWTSSSPATPTSRRTFASSRTRSSARCPSSPRRRSAAPSARSS